MKRKPQKNVDGYAVVCHDQLLIDTFRLSKVEALNLIPDIQRVYGYPKAVIRVTPITVRAQPKLALQEHSVVASALRVMAEEAQRKNGADAVVHLTAADALLLLGGALADQRPEEK